MLFVCYGLFRSLRLEGVRRISQDLPASVHIRGAQVPWQQRLVAIISHPQRDRVEAFLRETVEQALTEVSQELRKTGLDASVNGNGEEVAFSVSHGVEREFLYAVRSRDCQLPSFAYMDRRSVQDSEDRHYWRAEVHLLEGGQHYDVMGYTKEQVISDVLSQYEKHIHLLHLARPLQG